MTVIGTEMNRKGARNITTHHTIAIQRRDAKSQSRRAISDQGHRNGLYASRSYDYR